jgi:tellurite methyltransferase
MQNDRKRWNEKYLSETYSVDPSPIVKKFYKMAPGGIALDIAAGTGRNAIFLAEKGFQVDAVDISDVGLRKISKRHPNLHPVCIDIDTFDIPRDRYGLILNIRFLSRRLFPDMHRGLIRGGVLICETYLEATERKLSSPLCHDYLLKENELLQAFRSLRIIFYQERKQRHRGELRQIASLVALKPLQQLKDI